MAVTYLYPFNLRAGANLTLLYSIGELNVSFCDRKANVEIVWRLGSRRDAILGAISLCTLNGASLSVCRIQTLLKIKRRRPRQNFLQFSITEMHRFKLGLEAARRQQGRKLSFVSK